MEKKPGTGSLLTDLSQKTHTLPDNIGRKGAPQRPRSSVIAFGVLNVLHVLVRCTVSVPRDQPWWEDATDLFRLVQMHYFVMFPPSHT